MQLCITGCLELGAEGIVSRGWNLLCLLGAGLQLGVYESPPWAAGLLWCPVHSIY